VAALLLLVGLNLAFDALGTLAMNQFVAAERMRLPAIGSALHAVALVALGTAGVMAGGRLWWVYVSVALASSGRLVAFVVAAARRGWRVEWPPQAAAVRGLVSAGWPLGIGSLASLAFVHVDKLVIAASLGSTATGHLTAAFLLVFGAVDLLGSSAQVALLPALSRVVGVGGEARAGTALHYICVAVIGLTLPVAAGMSWFAVPIISLIFGSDYGPAALVLSVTAWCVCTRTLEGFIVQMFTMLDRQRQALQVRAAGLVLNLAITVVLLGRLGLLAAAIGTAVGEAAMVLAGLVLLRLPRQWWTRTLLQLSGLLIPATALFGAFWLIRPWPLALASGVAVYAALTVAFVKSVQRGMKQAI
jgi:O-antigen/teichoic acid export membrane protein